MQVYENINYDFPVLQSRYKNLVCPVLNPSHQLTVVTVPKEKSPTTTSTFNTFNTFS